MRDAWNWKSRLNGWLEVSISSTSEEVRDFIPMGIDGSMIELVSISSTSEEVRDKMEILLRF